MNRFLARKWITGVTIGVSLSTTLIAAAVSHPSPRKIVRLKGPYLGILLGSSETHYNKSGFDNTTLDQSVTNGTVNSSGFGISPILGYQFNPYIALEGAYTKYANTTADHLAYSNSGPSDASGKIREYSVSLTGKFMYPWSQEVNVFARIGAAYLNARINTDGGFAKTRRMITPTYGLGADFNITSNFVIDIAYNRTQGHGRIENADLFGIGFYYHFGKA